MATSAAFANRAERLIQAASSLLLVPDLTPTERDAVMNARGTMRRALAQRETRAAAAAPTEATP